MRSIILPSILGVKGAIAKLDNILDEGTFKQDDVFWVGAQKIHRKAGNSAKCLRKSYVDLRIKEPELFKDLVVVDEIATTWQIEDLVRGCPQVVYQRDVFASALGDTCKKAAQLTQKIITRIASKMAPVLHLTDTDI